MWTLKIEKTDLKPGEAMVVLSVIDYSVKRYFDINDYKNVEIVAFDLGGLYPLSVNSLENPFMEDYQTFARDKTLSLNILRGGIFSRYLVFLLSKRFF